MRTGIRQRRSRTVLCVLSVSLLPLSAHSASAAGALPTGGNFAAGNGKISSTANTLTVNQTTKNGIINWNGFSIGQGNTVQINNGKGATLNRVTGTAPSTIAGWLNSTGSTYLVNQNGIVVTPSGKVITGGTFVGSTRDTSNSTFMQGGSLEFTGTSSGTVTNQGSISASGDAVLIGKSVTNSGSISAPNGTAGVVAGDDVVLQPSGSGLQIEIKTGSGDATTSGNIAGAQALIDAAGGNAYALAGNNGGQVRATGTKTINGHVWLTAPKGTAQATGTIAAQNQNGSGGAIDMRGQSINVSGTLNADDVAPKGNGGNITVGSATTPSTTVTGTLGARGGAKGGNGGKVETSGEVLNTTGAKVDTTAPKGQTGNWTLDPADVFIESNAGSDSNDTLTSGVFSPSSGATSSIIDAGNLDAALNSSNVVVTTTNTGTSGASAGNITVSAPVSWTSANTLTLSADNNISIGAAIGGTNGTLNLTAGKTTAGGSITISGTISVAALNAAGGSIEGGGLITAGSLSITAANGIGDVTALNGSVGSFNLTSSTSGNIVFANTASRNVTGQVSAGGSGNVTISQSGECCGEFLTLGTISTANGNVSVQNTGADLAVDTISSSGGGSVSLATVTSGNVTLNAPLTTAGSVTLTSAGNVEGGSLITAGSLSITSANGIGNITRLNGSVGSFSLTNSTSGGIFFTNTLSTPVTAPAVSAGGSGNVTIFQAGGGSLTLGTISSANGNVSVENAAGNLTLTGSLTAGGGGSVSLTALGAGNVALNGPLTTAGSITLTADLMSISAAIDSASGTVTLQPSTASRPINIGGTSDPAPGADLFLGTSAVGAITANTLQIGGTGGTGTLTVAANLTLGFFDIGLTDSTVAIAPGVVFAGSSPYGVEDINISADSLVFGSSASMIKALGVGSVSIYPLTPSLPMNIGGTSDPSPGSDLFLSTAGLSQITASSLNIGQLADTGLLTVTGTLSNAAGGALQNATTVSLKSATGISVANAIEFLPGALFFYTNGNVTQAAPISTSQFNLEGATGNFVLTNPGNYVNALNGSGANVQLVDTDSVALDLSGFNSVTVTDSHPIGIDVTSLSATTITLTTDSLFLGGGISGGSVTIEPYSPGRAIFVGGTDPNVNRDLFIASLPTGTNVTLGNLADTGLLTINGAVSPSGNLSLVAGSGGIAIANPIAMPASSTLTLSTAGGSIVQSAAISAPALALSANVALSLTNSGNSIASISGSAHSLTLADSTPLTVSASGLSTGASTTLIADSISLNGPVTASTLTLEPATASLPIALGGTIDPNPGHDLFVSNASLGEVNAPALAIGTAAGTGVLTVSGAVSVGTNLSLVTGSGSISIANPVTITAAGSLALATSGSVTQSAAISTPAVVLSGSGNVTLANAGNTVGFLYGAAGSVSLTDSAPLTVAVTGLSVTGPAVLAADTISLNGTVTAATLTLEPATANLPVPIGGGTDPNPGSDFFLSTALLGKVTATNLVVGNSAGTGTLTVTAALSPGAGGGLQNVSGLSLQSGSGAINIANSVTLGSGGTLTLATGGGVAQTAPISAAALSLSVAGDVVLTNSANSIGSVSGSVGSLNLNDAAGLAVAPAGLSSTNSSGIALVATGTASQTTGVAVNGAIAANNGGPVSIIGFGYSGGGYGVDIEQNITGSGGAISVNGTGGNGGSGGNTGIYQFGSTVSNAGNGTITLLGTGNGSGGNSNDGVFAGGIVIAQNGLISITGISNSTSSGTNNYGAYVFGSVTSSGSGGIQITGTGGGTGAGGTDWGVELQGPVQSTGGGSLTVTGSGGDAGASGGNNFGVDIESTVSGNGVFLITGTGGNSSGSGNIGISLEGSITNTGSGNITLNGTGRGSGTAENGLSTFGNISVQSGGLTITGVAGAVGNGIQLNSGAISASGGAGVTLTGTATGSANYGIYQSANITTLGTGGITLTGTGGVAIAAAMTAGGQLDISSIGGNIVLNSGAALTAGGSGDALVIEAGQNVLEPNSAGGDFINNDGAAALNTPSGNWLVYTGDLVGQGTVDGGLTYTSLDGKDISSRPPPDRTISCSALVFR